MGMMYLSHFSFRNGRDVTWPFLQDILDFSRIF
jgi:hypothetical protein